jgi:hypothetical protein
VGQAALADLDVTVRSPHIDLPAGQRIRMRVRHLVPRSAWQYGGHHRADHLDQIRFGQRRPGSADPPQIDLMRFTDVMPVDHVPAVAHAGNAVDDLADPVDRVPGQQRRDPRRRMRAEHPLRVEIPAVAPVPGHRIRVETQPVVVVGNRDDPAAVVTAYRLAGPVRQRRLESGDDVLDRVLSGGRVGEIPQRQRPF